MLDLAVYRDRASNRPRPANWAEPGKLVAHSHEEAAHLAATGMTFFADWSEFQPVYTTAYPYPIGSFRAHNGYRLDNNAAANWHAMAPDPKLQAVFGYVVFIPGALNSVMPGLRNTFGSQPDPRLCIMTDMESGQGFAGPGNHSTEANQWNETFAEYLGTWAKTYGYANGNDWATCWPQADPRIKRHTANYNSQDPQPYGWQYAGGDPNYPSPSGYPRSCAPFGSYIDMNVIAKPISQITADFGITQSEDTYPMPTYDIVQDNTPNRNGGVYLMEADNLTWLSANVNLAASSILSAQYNAANPSQPLPARVFNDGWFDSQVAIINAVRANKGWPQLVLTPVSAGGVTYQLWLMPPASPPAGIDVAALASQIAADLGGSGLTSAQVTAACEAALSKLTSTTTYGVAA